MPPLWAKWWLRNPPRSPFAKGEAGVADAAKAHLLEKERLGEIDVDAIVSDIIDIISIFYLFDYHCRCFIP